MWLEFATVILVYVGAEEDAFVIEQGEVVFEIPVFVGLYS